MSALSPHYFGQVLGLGLWLDNFYSSVVGVKSKFHMN